jgi:hypothetical protein
MLSGAVGIALVGLSLLAAGEYASSITVKNVEAAQDAP